MCFYELMTYMNQFEEGLKMILCNILPESEYQETSIQKSQSSSLS